MKETAPGKPTAKEAISNLELLPEEQPEEFFARATDMAFSMNVMDYRGLNEGLNIQGLPFMAEAMRSLLAKVLAAEKSGQFDAKFSEEKRADIKVTAHDLFSIAMNTIEPAPDGVGVTYEGTNIFRLFGDRAGENGAGDIPYSQSMFGLLFDPHAPVSPELYEYMKNHVDGKVVMLFGGGDSVRDLIERDPFVPEGMTEAEIQKQQEEGLSGKMEMNEDRAFVPRRSIQLFPKKIINLEPNPSLDGELIVKGSRKDEDGKSKYVSHMVNAEDVESVTGALKEAGEDGADEIWASYSVPFYLEGETALRSMFKAIRASLKEGGTARISPLGMQCSFVGLAQFDQMRDVFADEVDSFNADPNFKAYVVKIGMVETLIIKRLKA